MSSENLQMLLPATILDPNWIAQWNAANSDSERAKINPFQFILSIFTNAPRDVLIIDEDRTFSTTIALAAMRGSFNRIWVTSWVDGVVNEKHLKEQLDKNAKIARLLSGQASNNSKFRNSGMYDQAGDVAGWKRSLSHELSWLTSKGMIDFRISNNRFGAHKISDPSLAIVPKDVIWFNHPWVSPARDIAPYLRDFMDACAQVHQPDGGVVLVTITRNPRWHPYYDVQGLVAHAEELGYKVFWDHRFMQDVFDFFGYRHLTWNEANDIHEHVVPYATTIIFVKD